MGALVASVAEGSPSDDAGIKAGDIILEFDGKTINEMNELPLQGDVKPQSYFHDTVSVTQDVITGAISRGPGTQLHQ